MKTKKIKNDKKNETFDKCFSELCNSMDKYTAWDSFIRIYSYEIANVFGNDVEVLKKDYEHIIARISPKERELLTKMFAYMVKDLEEDPYRDYLGNKYQELGLNDTKKKAQIFTPIELSKLMARISMGSKEEVLDAIEKNHGYVTLDDEAIGAGSTIIGALGTLKDDYEINYQKVVWVTGRDLSEIALLSCYIQLSLLGAAGVLTCGNSLTNEDKFSLALPGQFLHPEWKWKRAFSLAMSLESSKSGPSLNQAQKG